MSRNWRRPRRSQRATWAIPFLLVALLVWCSTAYAFVRTPAGTHCPTASVQFTTVAVKSACGHVIGHTRQRIEPGHRDFVQCKCAERRSAEGQRALADGADAGWLLAPSPVVLRLPLPLPREAATYFPASDPVRLPMAPPVPPPFGA